LLIPLIKLPSVSLSFVNQVFITMVLVSIGQVRLQLAHSSMRDITTGVDGPVNDLIDVRLLLVNLVLHLVPLSLCLI
jgi:hypothetical protein